MNQAFERRHGATRRDDIRTEREPAVAMFEKFCFKSGRDREIENRRRLDFYLDGYSDPT